MLSVSHVDAGQAFDWTAGYFKGESYTITFRKDGYTDKIFALRSSVDGWYFGNILFGGIIGMLIVDPATGAMYNLPGQVEVSLDQSGVTGLGQNKITIATTETLSESDKARLVRIN